MCARDQDDHSAEIQFSVHSSLIEIDPNRLHSYLFVTEDSPDNVKCILSDARTCPEIDNSARDAMHTEHLNNSPKTPEEISDLKSEISKQTNIVMFLTWLIYFYIFITIQLES